MGYKGSKILKKNLGRSHPRIRLKRFIPPYPLGNQLVTYLIQLTEVFREVLACAKPLHKLVTR